ncbi:16S rRNA (guanine(527)-N(7))-methyltransferase RsmG [Candidatus Pelagibacter bacterium]|nr:16S rRNA (guanine(527)-N(7))-methyltransferase RsmG [Candidatus Pelagibacter bacterium]
MQEQEVIKILQSDLKFTNASIKKLKIFVKRIIDANQEHNLISKSTESDIWHRHILDSAQLVKFISFKRGSLADLGTGAGFPGIVLAIFNSNLDFHVKLYEKSPVKLVFLEKIVDELELNVKIFNNIYDNNIDSEYIVSRAFKKLDRIIQVSREIAKKPHKLIILKGQNAQEEVNSAFKNNKYPYKLEKSMTNNDSKIFIADF